MAVLISLGHWLDSRDQSLMRRLNCWRAPKWLRLWMVAATRGGDYLMVEDGTTIYRMAPCTTRTLLMLGLDNQHVDDFKFVDPKELVPLIKRALRGGE